MKKIMLLGGSAQQVVAIRTAKRLGLSTVLCDFLTDNPGQYEADRFYLVSTTDREAVLAVAKEEQIDGIVAYASDPAAPTAAYVAEQLGLPTNPYQSVETLCNKDMFRAFLHENGFNAPIARGYSDAETALAEFDDFRLPVIVKPTDSSGSKGATVLRTREGLQEALEFAFSFSRKHRAVVEEFIEKAHPYLVGGDIFVWEGRVIMWGLMNCHRDQQANPLVPVGKSYPTGLTAETMREVRAVIQGIISKLGIMFGAVNVELIVDRNGAVWPIDFGPRCGGNMIPKLMNNIFGTDIARLSVQTAMGEQVTVTAGVPDACYATYNLHSDRDGVFAGVYYSDAVQPYVMDQCLYEEPGAPVCYFDNASKAVGIIFLKFPDRTRMNAILEHIDEHIRVQLR